MTIAANFQSEMTKSSSSFSRSLLVSNRISLRMSLTSAERKETKELLLTLCLLQQQQWGSDSTHPENVNISSTGLKVIQMSREKQQL